VTTVLGVDLLRKEYVTCSSDDGSRGGAAGDSHRRDSPVHLVRRRTAHRHVDHSNPGLISGITARLGSHAVSVTALDSAGPGD
jgi:hypothetical protein